MGDRVTFSKEDRDLFERLVVALERQAAPKSWVARNATPISVIFSMVGIVASILYSYLQLQESSEQFDKNLQASSRQFDRTMRENQYADIVDGLASSSVAVQVNSIRRLVQYVVEPRNFEDRDLQEQTAQNAAQTLASFIVDESEHPGSEGLSGYRDPQPVVVGRALDQLIKLTGAKRSSSSTDITFPDLAVDLSRGNFHGVNATRFAPKGPFLTVAADFRNATLTDWDLSGVPAPALGSAFFTCANMQKSNLGRADVSAADFTGANLQGADLSQVRNLTSAQLRGALIGPHTKLPPGVKVRGDGWGVTPEGDGFAPSLGCRHLRDSMTNLVPGSGYSSRLPCPGGPRQPFKVRLSHEERAALHLVCQLRIDLNRSRGQATTPVARG